MKKFLIRLILFLSVVYIIALLLDIIVSKGLQHTPKNHLETLNAIMNDTLNNDVLILGNSRGATAYNPFYLDSILGCNSRNISVSGQTYLISDMRYKLYRRRNPAPKLIILNIDQIELGIGSLGYERYQYYPYIGDTLIQKVLDMNHFTWQDKYVPLWRYNGNYKYIYLGLLEFFNIYHLEGKHYKGWSKRTSSWDGTNLQQILKTQGTIDCYMEDTVVCIFENLLNDIKQEDIKAIMVFSPMYHIAQENLSTTFDTIMDTYYKLSSRYDIPILDYRELTLNYDTLYFQDATHLNYIGAQEFSIKLAHDIDSIGWLK